MTTSPDDLQGRNVSSAFNILDMNRDGKLTAEDFDLYAARACEMAGVAVDSDNGRQLMGAFQGWWTQLRHSFDIDHNGEITLAEFVACHKDDQGDVHKYWGEYMMQATKIFAEIVDADKDGYLNEDEYLTFEMRLGDVDQQTALAGFRELDTDGDGRVSVAEFQAGVLQLMLSNDPSAPGTSILGQR